MKGTKHIIGLLCCVFIMAALFLVSPISSFSYQVYAEEDDQGYTQEQKEQAKAWLSAHGYAPTRSGAIQAYRDYLDGKFDDELGTNYGDNSDFDESISGETDDEDGPPQEAIDSPHDYAYAKLDAPIPAKKSEQQDTSHTVNQADASDASNSQDTNNDLSGNQNNSEELQTDSNTTASSEFSKEEEHINNGIEDGSDGQFSFSRIIAKTPMWVIIIVGFAGIIFLAIKIHKNI